jgi:hypothetical protein
LFVFILLPPEDLLLFTENFAQRSTRVYRCQGNFSSFPGFFERRIRQYTAATRPSLSMPFLHYSTTTYSHKRALLGTCQGQALSNYRRITARPYEKIGSAPVNHATGVSSCIGQTERGRYDESKTRSVIGSARAMRRPSQRRRGTFVWQG